MRVFIVASRMSLGSMLAYATGIGGEYRAYRAAVNEKHAFYRGVLGANIIQRRTGFVYSFGEQYLSVHGPGFANPCRSSVP